VSTDRPCTLSIDSKMFISPSSRPANFPRRRGISLGERQILSSGTSLS
jgi:hypothetical protein